MSVAYPGTAPYWVSSNLAGLQRTALDGAARSRLSKAATPTVNDKNFQGKALMRSTPRIGRVSAVAASIVLLSAGCAGGGGGGGGSTAPTPTYSIGGTIGGLTGSGLVLANGNDTVSPATGATSFTFATELGSGTSYAVTVKTQPSSELCQVANGSGKVASAAVTSVMVSCTPPWTWVGGSSTANAKGVYGTLGTAAAGNVPGGRDSSVSWIDSAGNLWLFGGYGYDSAGTLNDLNDLWRYSPGSGQWTWVGGSDTVNATGVYGTQGSAAAANVPGARVRSAAWLDSAGNLWLFGGYGHDSTGAVGWMNDLWEYGRASGQWTWIAGPNTINDTGSYIAVGSPGMPSARAGPAHWIDSTGNLWLFGGSTQNTSGEAGLITSAARVHNDLWRYSPGSNQWTWIGGSSAANPAGVYGTKGIATALTTPGGRRFSASWIDSTGNVWLFGGAGYDGTGTVGDLNDLWQYSPASGQWTWISGSDTVNAIGVYGTQGEPAAGNVPGARDGTVFWIDSAGNLLLFGGEPGSSGAFNDLWSYSPGSGEWTWVSGTTATDDPGFYSSLGSPGVPGGHLDGFSWIDSTGELWMFGGQGYDSAGTFGELNDLWKGP